MNLDNVLLRPSSLLRQTIMILLYPAMHQALAELHHNRQVRGLLDFSVLQEIVGFKEYYEEVKQYALAGDSSGDDPAC